MKNFNYKFPKKTHPERCSGDRLRTSRNPGAQFRPPGRLVTAEPQDEGEQNANDGLSEAATPFAHAPLPHQAIVAGIMPKAEVTVFAWIGVVALVGILLAALSMIACAFLGGTLPPLFGGL